MDTMRAGQASGFRLQASGFRLQASGFRLQASVTRFARLRTGPTVRALLQLVHSLSRAPLLSRLAHGSGRARPARKKKFAAQVLATKRRENTCPVANTLC